MCSAPALRSNRDQLCLVWATGSHFVTTFLRNLPYSLNRTPRLSRHNISVLCGKYSQKVLLFAEFDNISYVRFWGCICAILYWPKQPYFMSSHAGQHPKHDFLRNHHSRLSGSMTIYIICFRKNTHKSWRWSKILLFVFVYGSTVH